MNIQPTHCRQHANKDSPGNTPPGGCSSHITHSPGSSSRQPDTSRVFPLKNFGESAAAAEYIVRRTPPELLLLLYSNTEMARVRGRKSGGEYQKCGWSGGKIGEGRRTRRYNCVPHTRPPAPVALRGNLSQDATFSTQFAISQYKQNFLHLFILLNDYSMNLYIFRIHC